MCTPRMGRADTPPVGLRAARSAGRAGTYERTAAATPAGAARLTRAGMCELMRK